MKTSLQRKASEFAQWFDMRTERRWRTERLSYWTVSADAPEELRDLVAAAQGGYFRDPWRYDFIVQALNVIAVADNPDGVELANTISNLGLLEWFASSLSRAGYVDKVMEDYACLRAELWTPFCVGQAGEEEEVFQIVLEEIRELTGDPDFPMLMPQ